MANKVITIFLLIALLVTSSSGVTSLQLAFAGVVEPERSIDLQIYNVLNNGDGTWTVTGSLGTTNFAEEETVDDFSRFINMGPSTPIALDNTELPTNGGDVFDNFSDTFAANVGDEICYTANATLYSGSLSNTTCLQLGENNQNPSFSLNCSGSSMQGIQGFRSNTLGCSVLSSNGFNLPVNLLCENLAIGNCTFNPSEVTPPENGQSFFDVFVEIDQNAIPGVYPFVIRGSDGSNHHDFGVALTVIEAMPQGQLTALANPSTINQGDSTTLTFDLSNIGNVPLKDPTVEDSGCDNPPILQSGDGNGNGILDPGELWQYNCTSSPAGPGTVNLNPFVSASVCLDENCTPGLTITGNPNCVDDENTLCDEGLEETVVIEVLFLPCFCEKLESQPNQKNDRNFVPSGQVVRGGNDGSDDIYNVKIEIGTASALVCGEGKGGCGGKILLKSNSKWKLDNKEAKILNVNAKAVDDKGQDLGHQAEGEWEINCEADCSATKNHNYKTVYTVELENDTHGKIRGSVTGVVNISIKGSGECGKIIDWNMSLFFRGNPIINSVHIDIALSDYDGDGWNNKKEKDEKTDPFNPDTDGDTHIDSKDRIPLDPKLH